MTDDIVARLRAVSKFGGTHLDGLWTDAADKIERLRAIIEALEGEIRETAEASND